jgi:predicted nuclease of predicted toxin-antitoxin system
MARFYTNENMPLPVAEGLRRLGHDVLTVAESGNAGTAFSDREVLEFSSSEERILVTLNRRHFIRLHEEQPDHEGIIVCTFDADFARQAESIHDEVERRESMSGRLVRVNRPQEG